MNVTELPSDVEKQIRMQQTYMMKSPAEINDICDTGMFNSIIEGYCRIVLDDLGLSDKLNGYSFNQLFDLVGAAEARAKCK